jgi:hypothetical protein
MNDILFSSFVLEEKNEMTLASVMILLSAYKKRADEFAHNVRLIESRLKNLGVWEFRIDKSKDIGGMIRFRPKEKMVDEVMGILTSNELKGLVKDLSCKDNNIEFKVY